MSLPPARNEVILHVPSRKQWLHFRHPIKIITTHRLEEVIPALQEIEAQVDQHGRFAAGFLSYEAAPAMGQPFQVKQAAAQFPLLWFGIYPPPEPLPSSAVTGTVEQLPGPWSAAIREDEYHQAIEHVRACIARGETYQVNFTYRLLADLSHSGYAQHPWPLFAAMAEAHAPPYAAFLQTDQWAICSFSPELFFTLEDDTLTSLPMKGTVHRGLSQSEDQSLAEWLLHSEKNRAENLMIVDMVRNDIGRVARTGSVRVPRLFQVDKYPTVWQMISSVQGETSTGLTGIMQGLFPAASITGAPKVRTMQIIAELESTPRQIYTGTIGYYAPGRSAQFNVAIRTLLIDAQHQQATYGVGGGIVWDSDPAEEWAETITKARILHEPPQPFHLLETMRWSPGDGWFLLEQHIARLHASAEYFAFPLDLHALRHKLAQAAEGFQDTARRVRLLLARDGTIHLEAQPLSPAPPPDRIAIAKTPIHTGDRFLYHKTTRRALYQRALDERPGFDDVLLRNERGEVTESCIANLIFEQDGKIYTPPVTCGLLPGTYRAWMLETGQVQEKVLPLAALNRCQRFYLINSVRGMWQVTVTQIDLSAD
jgi:para-aminobenzoate synthetase / 4-amino-4-deoxychorismate lyase